MKTSFQWLRAFGLRCVAGLVPPCHEVTRLVSQGLDRPLPWTTRLRLRVHFLGCVWCRRYREQLQNLRAFARGFPERGGGAGTPGLSTEARTRIETALRGETGR